MAMKREYWLLMMVFAVLLNGSPVLADGDFYVVAVGGGVGTKITSLPYIVSKSGFYYLSGDLTSTGAGIIINVDNVTIDLMGFSLNGEGGLVTEGIAINGRKNVEVRNGTIRSFYLGIHDSTGGGANDRIINVRCLNNIQTGISLEGKNHLIKGCTLSDNIIAGIILTGAATISGNMVYNSTTCINFQGAGSIIGNTVIAGFDQTGISVSTSTSNYVMLDQNTVSGAGTHFSGGSSSTVQGTNSGF
jgi:hypothetical protein